MDYTIVDPKNTYIIGDTKIGKGAIIYPFNVIIDSIIEEGAVIGTNNYIQNSVVKPRAKILYSVIEDSVVGEEATIGPFSHLRPHSNIGDNCRIGNFVEVKNSTIKAGTKSSHLTYIGDADIEENVNIGCGVVFVNYNGKVKNRTRVKKGSFIGSSVNLIAPITVGEKAFVCAGTTLDKNVDDGDFVIGRSRMQKKPGRAKDYLKGD